MAQNKLLPLWNDKLRVTFGEILLFFLRDDVLRAFKVISKEI